MSETVSFGNGVVPAWIASETVSCCNGTVLALAASETVSCVKSVVLAWPASGTVSSDNGAGWDSVRASELLRWGRASLARVLDRGLC